MKLNDLPADLARRRVVGTEDAASFVGMTPQAFRKALKAGIVPTPIMLGERKRGFVLGELADWVAARVAQRGTA